MSALAEAVGRRDRPWKDQAAFGIGIATLCAEGDGQLPGPLGESAVGILLGSTSPLDPANALGTALCLTLAAVADLTGEEPHEVMRRLRAAGGVMGRRTSR